MTEAPGILEEELQDIFGEQGSEAPRSRSRSPPEDQEEARERERERARRAALLRMRLDAKIVCQAKAKEEMGADAGSKQVSDCVMRLVRAFWKQLPWRLFGLADHRDEESRAAVGTCLELYRLATTEARGHWRVSTLVRLGTQGRKQLERYADGEDMEALEVAVASVDGDCIHSI